ncbi:MAG TPA: T9SS type A sorting domain-containing protein, partial [Candidatus Marinimicrobia bacterium]|nr:T9SS type A sorting domain-containing protein [Candidatus Neomarinimicrobiota bacterium]
HVTLSVYDILGRQITTLVDQVDNPGYKSIQWNGTNNQGQLVSAGMYFYHLQAGRFSKVRKMVLLK